MRFWSWFSHAKANKNKADAALLRAVTSQGTGVGREESSFKLVREFDVWTLSHWMEVSGEQQPKDKKTSCGTAAVAALLDKIIISSSHNSIVMQSSAVHRRAVSRKSAHSAAPTLRSNATTSCFFVPMASLRGVLPDLQGSE